MWKEKRDLDKGESMIKVKWQEEVFGFRRMWGKNKYRSFFVVEYLWYMWKEIRQVRYSGCYIVEDFDYQIQEWICFVKQKGDMVIKIGL